MSGRRCACIRAAGFPIGEIGLFDGNNRTFTTSRSASTRSLILRGKAAFQLFLLPLQPVPGVIPSQHALATQRFEDPQSCQTLRALRQTLVPTLVPVPIEFRNFICGPIASLIDNVPRPTCTRKSTGVRGESRENGVCSKIRPPGRRLCTIALTVSSHFGMCSRTSIARIVPYVSFLRTFRGSKPQLVDMSCGLRNVTRCCRPSRRMRYSAKADSMRPMPK